jgi:hypothetical protein
VDRDGRPVNAVAGTREGWWVVLSMSPTETFGVMANQLQKPKGNAAAGWRQMLSASAKTLAAAMNIRISHD